MDELDAHLRELKRELSRREWEVSWLEDHSRARIHNLDALRRQFSRSTQSERAYGSSLGARTVSVSASAA